MLEKYFKLMFRFKLKKNINMLLIILVLLILGLLFFGNSNLVEGITVSNPRNGATTPLVGNDKIQSFTKKMVQAQNY